MSTFRIKRFTRAEKALVSQIKKQMLNPTEKLTAREIANLTRSAGEYSTTKTLPKDFEKNKHIVSALKKMGITDLKTLRKYDKKRNNAELIDRWINIYGKGNNIKAYKNYLKDKQLSVLKKSYEDAVITHETAVSDAINTALKQKDPKLSKILQEQALSKNIPIAIQQKPNVILAGNDMEKNSFYALDWNELKKYIQENNKGDFHYLIPKSKKKKDFGLVLGRNLKDSPSVVSHEMGHIDVARGKVTRPTANYIQDPSIEGNIINQINEGAASAHAISKLRKLGVTEEQLKKHSKTLQKMNKTYGARAWRAQKQGEYLAKMQLFSKTEEKSEKSLKNILIPEFSKYKTPEKFNFLPKQSILIDNNNEHFQN